MSELGPLDETRDLTSGDWAEIDGGTLESLPDKIGRYRIDKVLGKGGFGIVYLAYDDQLNRPVAIKVPHAKLINQPADAEAYLTEARTVASLDHPHIVPVHDVGSTQDYPCYVVSKYVDGTNLSSKLKQQRLSIGESVELVATVAEALHYAHKRGFVHRDVKPGNILLDTEGNPFVVDFGLALREEDIGKGPRYVGTPVYMSPEQACGEGHRVDGRSDIFSLGVVLYELLVARRPFQAETKQELLVLITTMEARPPRQIDDSVNKELERICLRAISKRANDRYTTALDFSDDLRHYLDQQPKSVETESFVAGAVVPAGSGTTKFGTDSETPRLDFDSQPIRFVPKGLRSFDAHDADFFLKLLPGPCDRNGLPDSLRFWKTRIEETDSDDTFSIGLIYGPSGCGKSSFVKAGLLPRLSDDVISVYVEARPDDTETQLLHGLRKRCLALDDKLNLKETLAALRRGVGVPTGKNVLIVLDQFEQWLHAKKEQENTELVRALRQCDGGRVQCIVMVRDDFWMAATRFGRELEVNFVPGDNMEPVDLFPVRHAKKVLASFGRAFGTLPDEVGQTTKEQKDFIEQAVTGLAEEGKIICIRLALFAEIMKNKEWTAATLKSVGGASGVGVRFLEETFNAQTAVPRHRMHQKAARDVLKLLMPDSGTDIKGEMKSCDQMLAASGYLNRPRDFADLIQILDAELRLITPADPEGRQADDDLMSKSFESGKKYYQLTHDYLVHSLRDWLTRKQRETRRGRAELQVEERAAFWNANRERRHLPSLLEWFSIRILTDRTQWSRTQRLMMGKAARLHLTTWSTVMAIVLAIVIAAGLYDASQRRQSNRSIAKGYVEQLVSCTPKGVPAFIELVRLYKDDATPALLNIVKSLDATERERLHAAYALMAMGIFDFEFPIGDIALCQPGECTNLVIAFSNVPDSWVNELKTAANAAATAQDWKLQARLATLLLHHGQPDAAVEMVAAEWQTNRNARTAFETSLTTWHGTLAEFATRVAPVDDPNLQSSICSALGRIELTDESNSETSERRDAWRPVLQQWQDAGTSAAVHGNTGWLAREWQIPINAASANEANQWQYSKNQVLLVKLPSLADSPIEQALWMSAREVTVGEFRAFFNDKNYAAINPVEFPDDWQGESAEVSRGSDHPVQRVNWYDAVMYCNWLSRQEGLVPAYELTGEKESTRVHEYDAWRRVEGADGYRLPTESEWITACNGTASMPYWFGNETSLLPEFAVYSVNAGATTAPVASKPCNDFGLFDMHGNVAEWCDNKFTKQTRAYKGGSWFNNALECTVDARNGNGFGYRGTYLGFRVVRP